MFLLVGAQPDKTQRAVKWLCVCVCVCVCAHSGGNPCHSQPAYLKAGHI